MDFMEKAFFGYAFKNKVTLEESVTLQIMEYCVLSEKEGKTKDLGEKGVFPTSWTPSSLQRGYSPEVPKTTFPIF